MTVSIQKNKINVRDDLNVLSINRLTPKFGGDLNINGVIVGHGKNNLPSNTALGVFALRTNFSVTTASSNTAIGYYALASNTIGNRNTVVGSNSLITNSTGCYNVSIGSNVAPNQTAGSNVGIGDSVLYTNLTGSSNVAIGTFDGSTLPAMYYNTSGSCNIAIGVGALKSNQTGNFNVVMGCNAATSTTGSNNVVIGYIAGQFATSESTFVGYGAGRTATAGSNTGVGYAAVGYNGSFSGTNNTGVGLQSLYYLTTGGSNTAIGVNSGFNITSGSGNSILGRYSGNQNSVDIRTTNNNIVLSDGDGTPKLYFLTSEKRWISSYAGGFNGETTYTKGYGSLDTTGNVVAGLISAYNGASALFEFTCFGGNGSYKRFVFMNYGSGTNWVSSSVATEGTGAFDITVTGSGTSTVTFTFKTTSGTISYSPTVVIKHYGVCLNSTYLP